MSRVDLRYAAGFFDGEGSVGIYGHPRLALRACITQVATRASQEFLTELKDRFGGSISRVGRQKEHHRRAIMWSVYGHPAARFLRCVRPHLRLKAKQADIAVKWQDRRPPKHQLRRDREGHILKQPNTKHDLAVAAKLKNMKRSV